MRSYIAKVKAGSGLLLGGVKAVESSRFALFKQAVRWSDAIIEGNQAAGRVVLFDGIRMSDRAPEIDARGEVVS